MSIRTQLTRAGRTFATHPRPCIALAGLLLIGVGAACIRPEAGLITVGALMFIPAQVESWLENRKARR